jgi:hypothetical protein
MFSIFLHSTLSQILEETTPDLNLLIAARSQDRMDVVIRFSQFGGDGFGLSIAIHYQVPKSYTPTHNLIATIEYFL